jgi:hypothetical protein
LKLTIDDNRIIGCDNLDSVLTWIDAAFAVHQNMRSQTGGAMSFGWGTIHARSSKQKLKTKSSTEAELVGLSEYIPYNIWLINFFKAQGYEIKHNIVYQDNQSAIRMAKNGRNSCTSNSRHIDIRYFFVKDRVDKGEFEIQYCPTYMMLANFFTKSLQGKAFRVYRDVVMGHKHISSLKELVPSRIKERVENRNVNKNKEIILEGTNTNMNRKNATRAKSKVEQKDSKRVNDMSVSFKDALVRSNYS